MAFEEPAGEAGSSGAQPSGPPTFEAAMDALSADAVLWEGVGESLAWTSEVTAGLTLESKAFSFMGSDTAQSYEEARLLVQTILLQGSATTQDAAHTLRIVRETYEGADEAAKARLEGTWDWE